MITNVYLHALEYAHAITWTTKESDSQDLTANTPALSAGAIDAQPGWRETTRLAPDGISEPDTTGDGLMGRQILAPRGAAGVWKHHH